MEGEHLCIFHGALPGETGEEVFGAKVGGHDDDGVGEVHSPSLPVRKATVIQHLK